jgi:hypothetical protein
VPRIAAAEDALAVRALTCAGRTPRYGDAAQKLIRRCGSALAGTVAEPPEFHCLLFEQPAADVDDRLAGLSAAQDAGDGICDWIVMGVNRASRQPCVRRSIDSRSRRAGDHPFRA